MVEFASNSITRVNHTGVHTEEGQVTHKRVGSDFNASAERLVVACMTLSAGVFLPSSRIPLIAGAVYRGWQVINYRIQHRLNTFVLKCRTTGYRDDFVVRERAGRRACLISSSVAPSPPAFFHQLFRSFCGGLDQVLVPFASRVLHVSRGYSYSKVTPLVGINPVDGFHFHRVNNAGETFFSTNCQLQGTGFAPRRVSDLTN